MVESQKIGLVLMLVREGSVQHAVRLYQEESGVSPSRARQAVRSLARRHGVHYRDPPFYALALVGLAAVIAFALVGGV